MSKEEERVLPTPNSGESEDDFISRCMSNEEAKKDFPDSDQRLAVCFSQLEQDDRGAHPGCQHGTNPDGTCKPKPRSVRDDPETRRTGVTNDHDHTYEAGDARTGMSQDHFHRVIPGSARTQRDDVGRETVLHSHSIPEEDRSMSNKERRFVSEGEIRARDEESGPVIEGHAAIFNTLSEDLGGFREVVKPGAFARAIKEKQDVRALVNHDPSKVMARTKNGTLELEEDKHGLKFRFRPNKAQFSKDMVEQIRRGDVDQVSFGFIARDDEFTLKADGTVTRELRDVDIFDISPTAFPAYPATSVEARSKVSILRNGVEESPSTEGCKEHEQACECSTQESVEETDKTTSKLRKAELDLSYRRQD